MARFVRRLAMLEMEIAHESSAFHSHVGAKMKCLLREFL
jgi:hypothetical protein